MCGPEDPLFTPLLPLARVPFQAKRVSSKDPLLRKFGNFSHFNLNFHPKFSSQAPKFGNFHLTSPKFGSFQLTSPQIWKFSAHKPPFSEANVSSQAPYFGNLGRTPLPEKKLSAPPPPPGSFMTPSFWALGNPWAGNDPQSLQLDPQFFYFWLLQGSSTTPDFKT